MKRRIGLSIALALSVAVLAVMSSDSKVKAQPGKTLVADTGLVTLAPNQRLRITVANGLDPATVRFRTMWYTCSGGTCETQIVGVSKYSVSSQALSDPTPLAPGEAASYNLGDTASHVRVIVSANRQSLKVNVMIVNVVTGEVTALAVVDNMDVFQ